ncbi:MAG: protein translocase subunit SecD [Clostridia bacterium]|nr:protein translocase subunit SecD [Clostridia bacterium]
MKKKSSIVKLSIIGVVLIIGIVLSFCSFDIGLTTYKSFASSISLGLDLKGGVYAVYEAVDDNTANLDERMEGTRTMLLNLLVQKGYTEATIVKEGTTRLRVEVPDVDNPSEIFDIIGKPASIRFVLDSSNEQVITGEHIVSAEAGYTTQDGYVVQLSLNSEGADKFYEATSNHVNEYMSIYVQVQGEEEQRISQATISTAIAGGRAVINGMGSYEAAKNLADQIMSGTFEVRLALMDSSTVSPTLGEQALFYGLLAGIIGLALVIVFLCVIYRMLGVAASVSLMVYAVLMLFFLAVLPGVQLTLPGIAGIILSLGMAVDANVIIYERMKFEYRNGKSIMASSYAGFRRATMAIIDSNVTTIIAGIMLFIFGTGSIKGFAITLLLGIVLSLFTSMLVSRLLVRCFVNINSTNPKLYGFKRGKGFENVDADKTDVTVQRKMDEEEALKEEKRRAKKNKDKNAGGLAHENI